MGIVNVNRNQRYCALCRYWNGAIGSTAIQILPGGNMFRFENREEHSCFKKGRGMQTNAMQSCSCFVPRYEE